MAEVLGVGITHYPALLGRDVDMAWVLRWVLEDPDLPAALREPSAWPEEMQQELGNDDGLAAAARHRDGCLAGLRKVRAALDEFQPDVVLIWGDDQYENFREDLIPAFSVLAYDDVTIQPFAKLPKENVWGEPADAGFTVRGAPEAAKALTTSLIEAGFDVAYAYEPLHHPSLPHAFANAVVLLDYDRIGFDYPVVALPINCYGRRVISFKGGRSRLGAAATPYDPPSPSPARCMDFGAAVARAVLASPLRVAVVASSSWSHAFMAAPNSFLHPDHAADRRLFDALVANDFDTWRSTSLTEVERAGQQEVLNWFCLLGAMEELGTAPVWSDLVETHLFNSNKAFVVYSTASGAET